MAEEKKPGGVRKRVGRTGDRHGKKTSPVPVAIGLVVVIVAGVGLYLGFAPRGPKPPQVTTPGPAQVTTPAPAPGPAQVTTPAPAPAAPTSVPAIEPPEGDFGTAEPEAPPSPEAAGGVTIVSDGRPRAALVVGPEPTPTESLAAEEIRWHIRRMSGAELPVVASHIARPPEGIVPIYIGRAAGAVGIDAGELTLEHYRVVTGPDWIAVAGRDGSRSERVDDPLRIATVQPGTLFGVYHLLDDVLGVRWLWPGEEGTFVPKRRTIAIPALDVTGGPKLLQRHMRNQRSRRRRKRSFADVDGLTMTDDSVADRLDREERLWLRRHRMGRRVQFGFGHAFTRWWDKYAKDHPEYFATLPAGKRQPAPKPDRVKLCVSNPAVTDRIIADWKAAGAGSHLRACPNDSRAYCTCENCRRWDLPVETTPENVDQSVLTYRYVKFWKILAEKVAAVNPDVFVCGYAYSNYRQPPDGVRLPSNVILGYVGGMGDAAKEGWRKWSEAGVKLYFRPNWFHAGHNAFYMPLHEAGSFMKYAQENDVLGTDFDSLLGHYATQGPYYYVVARVQAREDLSVEEIIQEYCDAFGPAAPEIRKYLDYWESFTDHYSSEVQKHKEQFRGSGRTYLRLMPQVFDDETLAPAERLLKEALKKVERADPIFARRIRFLQEGIRHVRMTRDAVRYGDNVGTVRGIRANALKAVAAAKALRNYRKTIEDSFVDWTEYTTSKEIGLGDYTGLRLASVLGDRTPLAVLPPAWYFQFDPADVGEKEGWFELEFDPRRSKWPNALVYRWWERNTVGKEWKKEHGEDYDGVAWYRTRFTPPELPAAQRVKLLFGAVDESCKVWLNGRLVGEHPFVKPDDWKTPFEFDVTDFVVKGTNHIAVRVVDEAGAGGIWKLVWLLGEK